MRGALKGSIHTLHDTLRAISPLYSLSVYSSSPAAAAVICLVVFSSAPVLGQTALVSQAPAGTSRVADEWLEARLRYGASVRSGEEQDLGPGLSYAGVTPNDVALSGWWWFLFGERLGINALVHREAFALLEGSTRVTQGGLVRASLGPTARLRLGPVRFEGVVAYLFHQMPVFGTIETPAFAAVQRHGVLLAARGLVDLGPVRLEGRFEYPLALAHSLPGATSSGLGAGGAARLEVLRLGHLRFGILAEVLWQRDTLGQGADLLATQSVIRAGGAVSVAWQELAAPVALGGLRITVTGAGVPMPGASVQLSVGGQAQMAAADASGVIVLHDLAPGPVAASVEAAGYVKAEARGEVLAGHETALVLSMAKEPPKVGSVRVRVVSKENDAPIEARVGFAGQELVAQAGVLLLEGLAPGPVAVKVTAEGFLPQDEAAQVVAGRVAELTVALLPVERRVPATLSGHIRSARGGAPVVARLEVVELGLSVTTNAKGGFELAVPGGTYTVRVVAAQFTSQKKKVTVRDGDQAILNIDLFPR